MVGRVIAVLALIAWVAACAASIAPMKPRPPIVLAPPAPADAPPAGVPGPSPSTPVTPPATAQTETESPGPGQIPGTPSARSGAGRPVRRGQGEPEVRVALATEQRSTRLSASGAWNLYEQGGDRPLASARAGDVWTVESCGDLLCATNDRGERIPSVRGPLIVRPADDDGTDGTVLSYNGRRYRGELHLLPTGSTMLVVNRLPIESYLRGVVPLEIGTDRTTDEEAAVEAQAIAARSYTYTRLDDTRSYDLTATVMDQVYGGADAERPLSDASIEATRDLVLFYDGRVVNAPYHANSGGATAAQSEVWRAHDEPYLVSVSDRIPGSDRYYCEQSPKFRWTRSYDGATLTAVLDRYLRKYADVPSGGVGAVRAVQETGRTQSGRVAGLVFVTDRGRFGVRGNDVRFVLRTLGGDILPSTLFTIESESDGDGRIERLVLRGTGNGHGVGMDQWGAIARARAGQDYRTILLTYYPGTTIAPII